MNKVISNRLLTILRKGLLLTVSLLCLSSIGFAQTGKKAAKQLPVIFSLNAYSFNDLLLAKDKKENQPLFTMFNLMDWCATQKIPAVDLTGYYFPNYPEVPTDEYILKIKNKSKQVGVAISGTGVRNNFASPDPAIRAADVAMVKKWIVVASKLGAPVIRVFSGAIPKGYENKWDEVAGWMIECYKECAVFAGQHGVKIGIQNHGDMLQTADQCIKIMKAVNSKWVGMIVDTGSFYTADPYVDIEAVVPYAISWQIKEFAFGIDKPRRTDLNRTMKIIKKGGYKGYVPIETIQVSGVPYDPFALVPALLKGLHVARDAAFN